MIQRRDESSGPVRWTIGALLKWTEDYFMRLGFPSARLDAEILLAAALSTTRLALYTEYHKLVEPAERARFRSLVERRARSEPVAYIVGRKEFYSLSIAVSPAVLIPRPETEHLVECGLEELKRRGASRASAQTIAAGPTTSEAPPADGVQATEGLPAREGVRVTDEVPPTGEEAEAREKPTTAEAPLIAQDLAPGGAGRRVLDLGTGSGNVAIAVAVNHTSCIVEAVDISPSALAVARANAAAHGVEGRIRFSEGSWFQALPPDAGAYAVILSNPPYVSRVDYERLMDDVRKYEPREALLDLASPDGDGLGHYRVLAAEAAAFLESEGLLAVEIGAGMCGPVTEVFSSAGWRVERVIRDYGGIERVVALRR